MARYVTTHQYEPLRTPSRWDAEEKRLIVQLTEIFDDIYRRYGRLGLKDVGTSFQGVLSALRDDVDANGRGIALRLKAADVKNNLTTTEAGKALDARQGKALNEAKLDKSAVTDTLTEAEPGKVLDARQGKALNEAKLDKTDVVTTLTETAAGKALDASIVPALMLAIYPVGSVYWSTVETAPTFGGVWTQGTSPVTGVYLWERTA